MKQTYTTLAALLLLGMSTTTIHAGADRYAEEAIDLGDGYCARNSCEVPELSAAAGPLAVALLIGIVGLGRERRKRISKK